MDFQRAAKRMHNSFTLEEKKLAKEYAEDMHYDENTRTAYIRAPLQNLGDSVARANEINNAKATRLLRRLVLYCDTLEVASGFIFGHTEANEYLDLRIFTRRWACQGPCDKAMSMIFDENISLEIYTHRLPPGFTIEFQFTGGIKRNLSLSVDEGKWGVQVNWYENEFIIQQSDAAMLDMSTADYLDRIKEDGTLEDGKFINDFLPRLVYYQFLVAASQMFVDHSLALDVFNWVCNLSASKATLALNIQACSLRNSLVLSQEGNVFNVPSVNIYASKEVLKSRLMAAMGYENAFQTFAAQERISSLSIGQAIDLIGKSEDAKEEYMFLLQLAQKAFDGAVMANKTASARFVETQKTLEARENDFKTGIKKWAKEKKAEAAGKVVLACIFVVAAVVATVATGGAAAPAVAVAGEEAVSTGTKFAELIKKITALFKKIKEVYDKLENVIKKLVALAEAIQKLVQVLRSANALQDKNMAQRPDMSSDLYNSIALWDIFHVEIQSMEKELKDINCDGKADYFVALYTLVINGKTYLQTQANLCNRGNELAVMLLRLRLQKNDGSRLQKTLENFAGTTRVLGLLKRAMFDRLLALRTLVFLDFHIYAESYMFHTLSDYPPIKASPVKAAVNYLEDAARLQGCVATFGSTVMIQNRQFIIQAFDTPEDALALRRQLQMTGSVTVSIEPDHAAFEGFCRIRLGTARCFMKGLRAFGDSSKSLRLNMRTPGRFYDIELPAKGSTTDTSSPGYRAFVGDPRTLLFEYRLDDLSIVCDGAYGQEMDYTRQTPLTEWEIAIAPGGLNGADLDFSELAGIRLEFWCHVTLC